MLEIKTYINQTHAVFKHQLLSYCQLLFQVVREQFFHLQITLRHFLKSGIWQNEENFYILTHSDIHSTTEIHLICIKAQITATVLGQASMSF